MWYESLSPERPAKRAFWKGFEDDDNTSDDGRDGSAEGGQRSQRHSPEQIVAKRRDAEAMRDAGKDIAAVRQSLGVSEATLHRWRAQYGGMKSEEAKRLNLSSG